MKPFKRLVATTGKYTDATGQEKNRYVTICKAFQRSDGTVCLKIDSLPAGNEWNGWINLYDLDEERQNSPATGQAAQDYSQASGGTRQQQTAVLNDNVPF